MKFVKTFMIIIFVTGLLVFFQNCNVAQNTGLLKTSNSSITAADKVITDAPFAYDLVADTISYNSCVGQNLNSGSGGITGLKIGVNEGFVDTSGSGGVKAGLKLRSDFLQYVGKTIKPRYPSNVITPAQIQGVISKSPINTDTHIQFSVRKKLDLSVVPDLIRAPSPAQISSPRDGTVLNQPLYADPVLTNLTKNVQFGEGGVILSEGPRIYNLQGSDGASTIEAGFGFSNYTDETYALANLLGDTENLGYGERYSETVRDNFNTSDPKKKYLLTMTYGSLTTANSGTDQGLSSPKRPDPLKLGNAYGRSYALQFALPADLVARGWKNTTLKSVIESNLSDGTIVSGAAWTCENFVIMKKTDWNKGVLSQPSCSPLIAPDLANTTIVSKLKTIRRHYSATAWNVGLFYPAKEVVGAVVRPNHKICLTPAEPTLECYLPTETVSPPNDVGVDYDLLTECYLYNQYGVTYLNSPDAVKANGRCAQYASVCTRTGGNF